MVFFSMLVPYRVEEQAVSVLATKFLQTHNGVKNNKISLCTYYDKNGSCPNWLKCKFSHGHKEVRPILASCLILTKSDSNVALAVTNISA